MLPDWIKEVIKATGVQVPGMMILGLLMYFLLAGPMRDATAMMQKCSETLGETRGIMQWSNKILSRVDPNACCKPNQ